MGSGRGWLAGDWPSTGRGVLNITAAAWTAGFQWWRSDNITRTQNVSEYMQRVLAVCLVNFWATIKDFALCYRTVVCRHSVLSVTLVYCGQRVGWIKMPLGTEVGLGPGHIVLDWDQAPLAPERGTAAPHFSAHAYCGQTAGWIKMPLGMEIGLGPGDVVLDGDPAPPHEKGHSNPPLFGPLYSGTVANLSCC